MNDFKIYRYPCGDVSCDFCTKTDDNGNSDYAEGSSVGKGRRSVGEKNSDAQITASVRSFICDADARITVVRDEYGKPHISEDYGVYVSVTHDRDICLVAVARQEIGIDMEKKGRQVRNPAALARRYFCKDEIEFLGENVSSEAFCDMWVAKEALSKLIGKGVPCMDEVSIFSDSVKISQIWDYGEYIVKIATYN